MGSRDGTAIKLFRFYFFGSKHYCQQTWLKLINYSFRKVHPLETTARNCNRNSFGCDVGLGRPCLHTLRAHKQDWMHGGKGLVIEAIKNSERR